MKKLLLILSVISTIASCQTLAQKPQRVPNVVFKIPLGETIISGDVSITFSEIIEDSRCPIDVTCVWAGKAKVKVMLSILGEETKEISVVFEKSIQPNIASKKGCVFTAMELLPYPSKTSNNALVYELLVTKKCTIVE
tara:strand:- start:2820 stop:3233 length:414 start_codon:yes stop_codon:yes gene_type:complete